MNIQQLALASAFLPPYNQDAPTVAWLGHIPFAGWIMEAARPSVFVELGTHYGDSYFAFCQAVKANGLATQCYAVDTWQGDEHAGEYGEEVYGHVRRFHDADFATFSNLLRMRFDEALAHFSDGSVDLLHIDGLHTYEAVKEDFETWLPKLSSRAVVLFHDSNVRESDFGVWRYWEEVSARYPHIRFDHSHGLGVLFVGPDQPEIIRALISAWQEPGGARCIRDFFATLGQHLTAAWHQRRLVNELSDIIGKRDQRIILVEEDNVRVRERMHAAEDELERTRQQIADLEHRVNELTNSTSWRVTAALRAASRLLKG